MAANNKMTDAKYQEIRAGYAEAEGFDINKLTEEQEHILDEKMAQDGVLRPTTKALPGATSVIEIPSAGNSKDGGELAEAPKGKAAKGKGGGSKRPVSLADRSADIERVLVHVAHEGDKDGTFAAEVYRATFSNALNGGVSDTVNDALQGSTVTSGGVAGFLLKHGF